MSEEFSFSDLFSKAKAATDAVPPGNYTAVVTAARGAESSKGAPQVKVTLSIESGPHKNRRIYANHTMGGAHQTDQDKRDATTRMFFGAMSAYGLDGEFFNKLDQEVKATREANPEKEFSTKELMAPVAERVMELSPRVDILVENNTRNGTVWAQVKGVPKKATSAAPPAPGTPDLGALKEFSTPTPKATTPAPGIPTAF